MHDPRPYEQSVLGALLLASDARPQIKRLLGSGLSAQHFYYGRHRAIFTAMVALTDRDDTVDVLTVQAEMQRKGLAENYAPFGGVGTFLHSLVNSTPNVSALPDYVRRIKELSAIDQKRRAAQEIADACEREDYQGIVDAETRLRSIDLPATNGLRPRRLGVVG